MAAVHIRKLVPVIHGAPAPGRPDEEDTRLNAELIAAALERLGYESEIVEVDLDLSALERLRQRNAYAVFNLVEGNRGDGRLSHLACAVLDHLDLPYTGARTEGVFLTLTKSLTKRTLRAAGLPTADWWPTGEGAESEARVIVKSDAEHASYGMDAGSVVPGARAAAEIVARQARFGGRFIAEAFVEGREFNVALLETAEGPLVLPIPEIPFDELPPNRPRIVDYEAKWIEDSAAYRATTRRFGLEQTDPALAARLAEIARGCWDVFGLRGYARVDFRVSEGGEPFVLEVNANPCLAPDAGFASTARERGIEFDALVGKIVEAAVSLSPTVSGVEPERRSRRAVETPGRSASSQQVGWRAELRPSDPDAIRELVAETGFFTAAEIAIAGELAEERLQKGPASGYDFVLAETGGRLSGYACFGRTPGSDASFDLYWIAVARGYQGRGLGAAILERVENAVGRAGGAAVYAETSDTPTYAPTRAFYERAGFEKAAELPDFYRRGDGKVIYRKPIAMR